MDGLDVSGIGETIVPMLVTYGTRVIGVLIMLWISLKVAGWVQTRLSKLLTSRGFDETLTLFFGGMVRWLILLSAILACLGVFGVETTSFAAIIGSAGLAVGLAFQGTLSNVAAGVMLLVFRPFRVGDYVDVSGIQGFVEELGLFVTTVNTLDHRRVMVPNSAVTGSVIDNYTGHPYRQVLIDVGVDYSADVDTVRQVLDRAAEKIPGRVAEKGHTIFLAGLGGSSVDWQLRVWCKTEDYWDVYQATIRAAKYALDEAGIGIPFPQMDVHLDGGLTPPSAQN